MAYALQGAQQLREAGLRVEVDERDDRMQAKIRDAQNMKIPYILVVGDKEAAAGQVALRLRSGENLGAISVEGFLAHARKEIEGLV